ncbi:MAG: chlorite dismutase family protein [Chloroflexota bacterium]|jgi:chlorite dismutase
MTTFEMKEARPLSRPIDIGERGKDEAGNPISLDRRLFMQFLAFGDCHDVAGVAAALEQTGVSAVLYEDAADPYGIGLLFFNEDPNYFLDEARAMLNAAPFTGLTPKPEYTMFGRTYSIGYEQDLERVLINRPIERVCDPAYRWAVWYPLRRAGSFEQLTPDEQNEILREHGGIGRAYGSSDLAHDIRLACHGLDKNDNDFIAGLVGKDLLPLSHLVQRMRKTKQTSQHLASLGPFFIGRVAWQPKLNLNQTHGTEVPS